MTTKPRFDPELLIRGVVMAIGAPKVVPWLKSYGFTETEVQAILAATYVAWNETAHYIKQQIFKKRAQHDRSRT